VEVDQFVACIFRGVVVAVVVEKRHRVAA
jgi:hypothetical protein